MRYKITETVITIWEIEADSKQEALVFADEGVARPCKLRRQPNYKTIEAEPISDLESDPPSRYAALVKEKS